MSETFGKTFTQAATWTIDVACKLPISGAALDISGHTKHLLMSRHGVKVLDLASEAEDDNFLQVTANDWIAGNLRIKVLPGDQSALIGGVSYACEIWTVAPDGTPYDQASGTIEVRASGIPLAS